MKLIPLRAVVVPLSLLAFHCSSDDSGATPQTTTNGAAGSAGASTTSTGASTSNTTTASSGSTSSSTMAAGGAAGATGGSGSAGSTVSAGGSGGSAGSGGTGGSAGAGTGSDAAVADSGRSNDAGLGGDSGASSTMNFFVSSDTSATGNLGGLTGADARCQRLAAAVGQGGKTWRAYLSAMNPAMNARDRIGDGPYYNSAGVMVAATKDALHARNGDAALFITEKGSRISGQWGKVIPTDGVEHDILTGATRDGMVFANNTCGDWMSMTGSSGVGHSDGMGPGMSTVGALAFWNAAHTGQCADTTPGGGKGRIYCFVGP